MEEGLNILLSGCVSVLPIKVETEVDGVLEIKDLRSLDGIGADSFGTCGILVQHIKGNSKDKNHLDKYNRVIDIYNIIGIWTPALIEKE